MRSAEDWEMEWSLRAIRASVLLNAGIPAVVSVEATVRAAKYKYSQSSQLHDALWLSAACAKLI
jgi:hypothetical protein